MKYRTLIALHVAALLVAACALKEAIAASHGVEASLISQIRHRKVWASATADLPDNTRRKPGAGSPAQRLPNATLQGMTA